MSRSISAQHLTPLHSRPAAARPRRSRGRRGKVEDPGSVRYFPTILHRFPPVYVNNS